MELTDKQKQTIARIVERHTGWMVGWATDEQSQQYAYAKTAKKIAEYIKRQSSKNGGT